MSRPLSIYNTSSQSALQSRINQKRIELENLQQLRDLSRQLADQMGQLERKLSTLSEGAESVAEVLKNWNHVMAVLQMVGKEMSSLVPKDGEEALPTTLVRIPVKPADSAS